MNEPKCSKCGAEDTYADGNMWACPHCAHEWSQHTVEATSQTESPDDQVRDAFGNVLNNGDSVTVIKDLKVKGSSSVVKVGTKVKDIRLVDGHDGHNISCKISGIGGMNLKSEFVKKA
jgi:protein PhnA